MQMRGKDSLGSEVLNSERVGNSQRAIVWMPVGTVAPPPLLESLKKRGVLLTLVHSELLCMAHACVAHNQVRAGQCSGALVVLLEGKRLPSVSQTLVNIRRYGRTVSLWVFDESRRPSLREVVEQDLIEWGATGPEPVHQSPLEVEQVVVPQRPVVGAGFGVGAGAGLRFVDSAEVPSARAASLNDVGSGSEALSAEELSMLLGRDLRGQ